MTICVASPIIYYTVIPDTSLADLKVLQVEKHSYLKKKSDKNAVLDIFTVKFLIVLNSIPSLYQIW